MSKVMLGVCLFLSIHAEDVTVVCPYFWTTGQSKLICTINAARLKSCIQGHNGRVDFQWSTEQSTPVVACSLGSGSSYTCSSYLLSPGCRCTKGKGNGIFIFELHNVSLKDRSLENTSWECVISCDGVLENPLTYSRSEGCSSVKLVQSWASALNVPNFPEFELFSSTIIRVELNANVQNAGTCDAGIYNQLVMYLVKPGGQDEILCHHIYSNHDNTSKTIYQAERCVSSSVKEGFYVYDLQMTTDPKHDGAYLMFKSICLDNSRSYVFPQFYRIKNVFPWWFTYLYAVLITSAIVIFIPFLVIIYIALNFPIFITRPLCDVIVKVKEPITLKCKLTRPGVPVKWYFGFELLQNSPDFRLESFGRKHSLKIECADFSHDGTYRVEVNGMSSSAKVTVQEDELDELLDDLIFDIDSRPRKAAITQTRAAKIKDDKGEVISATIFHKGQDNIELTPNFNINESNSDSKREQAARKKSSKSNSQTRQAARKKSSKTGSPTGPQVSKTSYRAGSQTHQLTKINPTTTTNNKAKVDPKIDTQTEIVTVHEPSCIPETEVKVDPKIEAQTEMVTVQEPSCIPEKEGLSSGTDPPSGCHDEKPAKNIEESSQNVTTTVSAAVQQMVSDKLQGKHLFLKIGRKMVSSAIDPTDDVYAFMQSAEFWEDARQWISWKDLKNEGNPLDSSSFSHRRKVDRKMVSSAVDPTDAVYAFMQSAEFWEEAKRRISWKELKEEDNPLESSSLSQRRKVSFSSSISTFYVRLFVEIIGRLQLFMLAAMVLLVLCSVVIAYVMFVFFLTEMNVVPTRMMIWCVTTLNLNIFAIAFIIGSLIFHKKGRKRHRIKWFWDQSNAYERPVEKKICCGWLIYSFGQENKKTIYEIMLEDMTFSESEVKL